MSKLITLNDESVKNLMTVIRKNTQQSTCIDVFEKLLNEVNDKEFVKSVISDMNKFIEEFMSLIREIDKMETQRFMSKMLSDEFIIPERFFKTSLHLTNNYLYLNAALNMIKGNTYPYAELKFTIGQNNRLGNVWSLQHFDRGIKRDVERATSILEKFNITDVKTLSDTEIEMIRENCRKAVLLWNYCPAIIKAFVQTKRRSLKLDKNSKKFS